MSKPKIQNATTVALIYDKSDPVVDTDYVRKLSSQYTSGGVLTTVDNVKLSSCVLNFTDHSMLSRWDEIHNNKWWLNEMTCRVVKFLSGTDDHIRAIDMRDEESGNDFFCELNCTQQTCHYNRTETSVVC